VNLEMIQAPGFNSSNNDKKNNGILLVNNLVENRFKQNSSPKIPLHK
jgi:hypothetical protein